MKERVIRIDDVEVIDAPDRRDGCPASHHAAIHVARARPFALILRLLLHLLVALLSVIIVAALSIGQALGAALRRAHEALVDHDRRQTANSKWRERDGASST